MSLLEDLTYLDCMKDYSSKIFPFTLLTLILPLLSLISSLSFIITPATMFSRSLIPLIPSTLSMHSTPILLAIFLMIIKLPERLGAVYMIVYLKEIPEKLRV